MGVLAATMRLMILTATKNNLEFRQMNLTEKISSLHLQIAENEEFMGDLDPDSPELKTMNTERRRLNEYEKKIQMQLQTIDARLRQIMAEMDACRNMLNAGIQQSGLFTYGMSGR